MVFVLSVSNKHHPFGEHIKKNVVIPGIYPSEGGVERKSDKEEPSQKIQKYSQDLGTKG